MEMSVREARANFAAALTAAEKGERVTITKNGKAVAEIGPPALPTGRTSSSEAFWAGIDDTRRKLGLDKTTREYPLDEKWREEFDDPAWTRELFGSDYFDDEPESATR